MPPTHAGLRDALLAFRTASPTLVERMLALLDAGSAAFDRAAFVPGHFTASAFVVRPDRRELLLIHHRKLELWLQPGGHFEPTDADPQAAARRELGEETSLTAVRPLGVGLLDVDIHDIPARGDAPRHQHFDLRFGFALDDLDAQVLAASDAKDARWVSLDALADVQTDDSVRRTARRLATAS